MGSVRSGARHVIHCQFNTSANALKIRAIQSPKYIVGCAVQSQSQKYFIQSSYDYILL
jgi:hypothetical protein